jgi:hypothetical protein
MFELHPPGSNGSCVSLAGGLHHRPGMIDASDKAFGSFLAGHLCGNPWAEADLQYALMRLDIEQRYCPLGIVRISSCHAVADEFPQHPAWISKLLCDEVPDSLLHDYSPFLVHVPFNDLLLLL